MEIKIGIITDGSPRLEECGGKTILHNMLIGKDFHWQQTIEAILPGRIELSADPECMLINIIPIETYLECVVGSEMNPHAPDEFLKAHAIISRSWAVGKVLGVHTDTSGGKRDAPDELIGWDDTSDHDVVSSGFHVCSDDHCQRYQGIQPVSEQALRAIRSTSGMVLADSRGDIVDARFSKCCGGRSELFSTCWQNVDPPCLESVECGWCDLSALTESDRRRLLSGILKDYDISSGGGYRWRAEVSYADIRSRLNTKFGRDIGEVTGIKVLRRGLSGRASLMEVTGVQRRLTIGKELMIRRLLSSSHLYSSAFEVEEVKDGVVLHGRGWGHGVGLCQIGAANMALHGRSCEEILQYYYPGSRIIVM